MSDARNRFAFRPRPWPTLAAALLLPLLLGLGAWQLDRAEQKRALVEAFRAAEVATARAYAAALPRFTRVAARGRWDGEHQFLLDAAVHQGRVGFRVLTPLLLENGGALLVDRGWVAGDPARRALPDVALPERGTVELVGLTDALPRAGLATSAAAAPATGWPRVVLYPAQAELERALGQPLEPGVLRLDPAAPDGYARGFDPDFGMPRERHLAYATTWFALAATVFGLWIALNLRRQEPA